MAGVTGSAKHCKFYNTRHTAATLMIENKVPLEKVSKILGHKNIAITIKFYAKVDSEDEDVANIMGQVLGAAIDHRHLKLVKGSRRTA